MPTDNPAVRAARRALAQASEIRWSAEAALIRAKNREEEARAALVVLERGPTPDGSDAGEEGRE